MVFSARYHQSLNPSPIRIMLLCPSSLLIQHLVLAMLFMVTTVDAQIPATPAAQLDQLDNTYRTNLRKFHTPIIQDYLRELTKLKQSLAARNRNMDASLVQVEIDKVNKLASTSGILPYDSLNAPSVGQPADEPHTRKLEAAIFLDAGSETRSSPERSSLKEKPDAKALQIGAAEWKVEKITPGNYRVVMRYSCKEVSEDTVLTGKIAGTSFQHKLTTEDITGGINDFRFAKLGVISIDQELTKESFVLQSSDPTKAAVWVRQIILTKVKGPKNK